MKNILFLTLFLVSLVFSGEGDDLINVGDISFEDVNWNDYGDIFYSRRNIQDMTSKGQAVVIHFYTACYS
ncbi:MAG: hypothetical protein PF574_10350 [Candidatus Delongbacteria bacterium]|jgi:hypothetical protein|nr:hypothetical protein [Candidatus Delongbacteria bacterium]